MRFETVGVADPVARSINIEFARFYGNKTGNKSEKSCLAGPIGAAKQTNLSGMHRRELVLEQYALATHGPQAGNVYERISCHHWLFGVQARCRSSR